MDVKKDKEKVMVNEKKPEKTVTIKPELKPQTSKKTEVNFSFSEKDISEFKAWKEDKKVRATITANVPEDDKVYRMWKEESRLVKGIFRCRQPEGGNVKFAFRKYKWDKTQFYTMYDGESYEVPLAVARHLNKNCGYEVHSHILGPDGNPSIDRERKKSRMNFESTEFAVA